ncbi:hypothetical protein BGZ68_009787 [Mortierella alpina]|nr:hypothetical protein BGZ68_009787 [Mortierella alpina]
MTVDASACDASRIDVTQPWTVFVMSHSNNQGSRVVFSDIIAPGRVSEYTWVVQPTQYRAAFVTDPSLGISTTKEPPRPETEYYIRVQAVDKGKQSLLMGRSHTFVIGTALSKREDPPLPDLSAVGISTDPNTLSAMTEEPHLSVLDSTTGSPEETSTPLLNAQGALGESTGADLPMVPAAVVQEPAPLSVDPTGGLIDPTVPVAPITDAPVFPETPQDLPQESTPSYPNLPITVVEEVKKKQPPAEIFAKYAAAGAGILSTIGVGVGGVIGGVIGGTAGLVIGLLLAAANASFYA